MAIVEMSKVSLIGLQKEKDSVLKAIQEMSNIEVVDITDFSEENGNENITEYPTDESLSAKQSSLEQKLSQVKYTLEFLERFNKEKMGMLAGRQAVSLSELTSIMDRSREYLSIAQECRKIEEYISNLKTQSLRILNSIDAMTPWKPMSIPLEEIKDTAKTRILAGSVPKEKIESFKGISNEPIEDDAVYIEHISTDRENGYFLIIYHKSAEQSVSQLLKSHGFNKTNFSELKGTPEFIISQYEKELKKNDEEEKKTYKQVEKLASNINDLQILHDGLTIELERHKAMASLFQTGKVFILKGWTKRSDEKMIKERLSKITDAHYIEFKEPAEDEVYPVALKNNKLVEPFEVVTSLYSTPNPEEIDPNFAMAPFFFAFFGIMMGDAGYGIIIAILGTLFLLKAKPKGNLKKMAMLAGLVGIATFIWGVIAGSWFGDLGEQIAQKLGLKTAALWFNPMDNPVLMLGFCFGFGLIHVFVGMGIQAYMSIKQGKIWDAIFDQVLWFVLIIGLLLLFTPVSQIGKALSIIGVVGLILTQGRHKKNVFSKFFSGLLSLYNITGILSDVLSYSRLFALGLSTGVIGMVINLLASMMTNSLIGWVFAIIVMIAGHTLNIVINVLGAFVHSARLQYIEFFSKFFQGGGHAFSPLTIKTKYVDITN